MSEEIVKVGSGNAQYIGRILKKAGFVWSRKVRIQQGSYNVKFKYLDGDFSIAYNLDRNQFIISGWEKNGYYKSPEFLLESLKIFGAEIQVFNEKWGNKNRIVIQCVAKPV